MVSCPILPPSLFEWQSFLTALKPASLALRRFRTAGHIRPADVFPGSLRFATAYSHEFSKGTLLNTGLKLSTKISPIHKGYPWLVRKNKLLKHVS
jgi:hypothetical protein